METKVSLNLLASQSLSLEGLRNDIIRSIQVARKKAGAEVTQKLAVVLHVSDQYAAASARLHAEFIKQECQLSTLEVVLGDENGVLLLDTWYPMKLQHSPCTVEKGEILYGEGYKHYWAALDAWFATQGA